MPIKVVIRKNTYFDSVSLMSLSTQANRIEGIDSERIRFQGELNPDVLGCEKIVQLVERRRWIVCDGVHPDVSELFARGDLHLLQRG